MRLIVVDAFTDKPFSGNPAAVALLEAFEPEDRMQAIAAEMNLSETAFTVRRGNGEYELRWFTPSTEVDLCGHATLATAHVLGGAAVFHTRSGRLTCRAAGDWIEMDFPAWPATETALPSVPVGMERCLWSGFAGDDWLVELPSAAAVRELVPDLAGIAALGRRCLVVTAAGEAGSGFDFVSRVFGPNAGIDEDPVTGSAHCALAPYWASRLGRSELTGYQASRRGGTVRVRLEGERVVIAGQAVTVSRVDLAA